MTDSELKDLLRPHMARIVEAARKGYVPAQTATFSEAADDPADWGFTADDLPDFARYFTPADDGTFPGNLHTAFGVTPKQFTDETGLRRQAVSGRWAVPPASMYSEAPAQGEGSNPYAAEQLSAILEAMIAGDHELADAVAALTPAELAEIAGGTAETFAGWDEGKHPRADDGKFGKGGGSAGGGDKGTSAPAPAASGAAGHVAALDAKRKTLPAALAGKVSAWVKGKYDSLAEKYGPTGAKAVLAGMVLMAPIPAPGTVMIPIAVAEGVRRLGRLFRKSAATMAESAGPDALLAAAADLLRELYAEHGETPPAFDPDRAREYLESGGDPDELFPDNGDPATFSGGPPAPPATPGPTVADVVAAARDYGDLALAERLAGMPEADARAVIRGGVFFRKSGGGV